MTTTTMPDPTATATEVDDDGVAHILDRRLTLHERVPRPRRGRPVCRRCADLAGDEGGRDWPTVGAA